ncbi:MAG: hypothetical protein P4L65_06530 [Legionella sp.]|nr:hypothetical protein [Legionella sp.]
MLALLDSIEDGLICDFLLEEAPFLASSNAYRLIASLPVWTGYEGNSNGFTQELNALAAV